MPFGHKKKILRITLFCGDSLLYQGPLDEIPLAEDEILAGSVRFFNDPDPCYIHRGAVRIRFTAEIEERLKAEPDTRDFSLIEKYTGCVGITRAFLELG